MDSRTNAIVEAAAKIAANHRHGGNPYAPQSERAEGHDDAAQAIAADIRADLPAAIAALDTAGGAVGGVVAETDISDPAYPCVRTTVQRGESGMVDFEAKHDSGTLDEMTLTPLEWSRAIALLSLAPLPDDVRREVDAVRAFLAEMCDWSGREIAREAIAAFDRIAARLNVGGK